MDITGKVVYTKITRDANTLVSNAEFNTSGVYIVQVRTDEIYARKKIIIMK